MLILLVIAVAGIAAGLFNSYNTKDQQLSIKPELKHSAVILEPLESSIGVRTRLPFQTVITTAENATNETQSGTGEKQTCKKVLGAKVCATLLWQYTITRDGDVEITSQGERLQLKLPIAFSGVVSVDGRGGKIFGLRNKDIAGKLVLIADLDVNIAPNWCPQIDSKVSYEWISDPKIRLVGKMTLNLRKSVDKALQKKLTELQSKMTELVDCDEFRQTIAEQWRVHNLPVNIKQSTDSTLQITPINASVSDIGIQADHVDIAFELGATIELASVNTGLSNKLPLPDLTPYNNTPGAVEFSLLLEIPYEQLEDTLANKVVGKTFDSGGSNSLTVTSLALYPNGNLLAIDIGFAVSVMKNLYKTNGHIYITARPEPDPSNNTLNLTNLAFTREIESRVMSALTTLLRQQLLDELQDAATIDLSSSLRKIEKSVEDALSNPDKTAGVAITVQSPQVSLMALNPQSEGIAAIVHLSTQLDATISEDVLIR